MAESKETKTERVRFSILDFVIILLILISLIGLALRYDLIRKLFNRTALIEARVSFVAEAITPEEAAAFSVDTVFYTENGLFGTLFSAESEPAVLLYENGAGVPVSYESSELRDVSGIFSVSAIFTDDGCLLGGNTYIAAGSRFTVRAAGAAVEITVTDVSTAAG